MPQNWPRSQLLPPSAFPLSSNVKIPFEFRISIFFRVSGFPAGFHLLGGELKDFEGE